MAMCSYHTLARYDDCSRGSRARNLDDIRTKQREQLTYLRSIFRNSKMIQNRRTLGEYVATTEEEAESDFGLYSSQNSCHDEPDCLPFSSQMQHNDDTPSLATPCSNFMVGWEFGQSDDWSPSPSPAWSSSTSSANEQAPSSSISDKNNLPPCLFDVSAESARKSASPALSSTSSKTDHHQADTMLYARQTSYKSNKKQSPRSKLFRESLEIRSQINNLKQNLTNCCGNAEAISQVIVSSWKTVTDGIQIFDRDLNLETVDILTEVTANYPLTPEAVLHMLQHGLIFGLAENTSRSDVGLLQAVQVLLNIAKSTPSAIPYLADLVSRTKLPQSFVNFIESGFNFEAKTIVDFYQFITETCMTQIYNRTPLQPLIPNVLLMTGISTDTIESFGPVSTVTKSLLPSLLKNAIRKSLSPQVDGDFITSTFLLLANALKLIQILAASDEVLPRHLNWVIQILCCFRDSGIDARLNSLAKGLERKIRAADSSEHCSQGFGAETSATASLEQCRQFAAFYQQNYGMLSSNFAELMSKVEPQPTNRGGAFEMPTL